MQTDILSRLKIIAVPPEFIPRNLLGLIPPILIYICDDISIIQCYCGVSSNTGFQYNTDSYNIFPYCT